MSILDTISDLFTKAAERTRVFGTADRFPAPTRNEKGFLQANKGWLYAATSAIAEDFSDIDLQFLILVFFLLFSGGFNLRLAGIS